MKNQDLEYFKKGHFAPIDNNFIYDGLNAMNKVTEVQRKYEKRDMDTILNELHDAIVGQYLGFSLINVQKHGLDCKLSETENVFLESKVVSMQSDTLSATFNDTNMEKAEAFKDEKVWLALSVWDSASEIVFICFGQNEKIGDFLEERVASAKQHSRRSTQSISLSQLIKVYGFKIISVTKKKEELFTLLTSSRPALAKILSIDNIVELKDYKPPYKKKKNSNDDAEE